MNKEDFLDELRKKLSGLPSEEAEDRIAFYNEMINDRMEDGLSEADAVGEIGSVDQVAEQILSDIPFPVLVRERIKPKRRIKIWEIVLIVLGSPIWLPLILAAFIILISAAVVVGTAVACAWVVDLSFAVGSISGLLGIGYYIKAGNPVGALFFCGAVLACAGLAILLFFVCVWFAKYVFKGAKKLIFKIKILLSGREVSAHHA